jgi:flagellar basal-body rod protein FlgF
MNITVEDLKTIAWRHRPEFTSGTGMCFVAATHTDLTTASAARVRQGAVATSNVNPVLTLIEVIEALRVYEAAQRAARRVDEAFGRTVNDVGGHNLP